MSETPEGKRCGEELAEAERRQQRVKGSFEQHQQEAVQQYEAEATSLQQKLKAASATITELSQAKVELEAQNRALQHEREQMSEDNRKVKAAARTQLEAKESEATREIKERTEAHNEKYWALEEAHTKLTGRLQRVEAQLGQSEDQSR